MTTNSTNPIDESIRALPLTDPLSVRGLPATTFSEALGSEPVLVVFLRHFG